MANVVDFDPGVGALTCPLRPITAQPNVMMRRSGLGPSAGTPVRVSGVSPVLHVSISPSILPLLSSRRCVVLASGFRPGRQPPHQKDCQRNRDRQDKIRLSLPCPARNTLRIPVSETDLHPWPEVGVQRRNSGHDGSWSPPPKSFFSLSSR